MAGFKTTDVTKSWDGKSRVIQPLTLDVADGGYCAMVEGHPASWQISVVADGGRSGTRDQRRYLD